MRKGVKSGVKQIRWFLALVENKTLDFGSTFSKGGFSKEKWI